MCRYSFSGGTSRLRKFNPALPAGNTVDDAGEKGLLANSIVFRYLINSATGKD